MEKREHRDLLRDKDKDGSSKPGTPTQDSNHGEMDLRLTNSTQSIQNVVPQGSKKRCRDFDEKGICFKLYFNFRNATVLYFSGYCMRGEMCLFDHGVDPVVLEDVLAYNPNGTPTVVTSGVLPGPILAPPGHPALISQRMSVPLADNPYNPQAPHIWRDGRFRGPRPLMGIARV